MSLDTHLPALRARTLTAATVLADGTLATYERDSLLNALGLRENAPIELVYKGLYLLKSSDSQIVSFNVSSEIPVEGTVKSIRVEVLANPNLDDVTFITNSGVPAIIPNVGVVLDYKAHEGEELEDTITIILAQNSVPASFTELLITYTYT